MINASELRIGNKLQSKDGTCIVTVLTLMQHVMDVSFIRLSPFAPPIPEDGIHGYAQAKYKELEPIPITPELLYDCGFERTVYRDEDGQEFDEVNGYTVYQSEDYYWFDIFLNSENKCCVHYLKTALYKHPQDAPAAAECGF